MTATASDPQALLEARDVARDFQARVQVKGGSAELPGRPRGPDGQRLWPHARMA